jgi:uncharacterized protein (TIGR02466 family)
MSDVELFPLFPTVVYKTQIATPLTDSEFTAVNSFKLHTQGLGNDVTDDFYALDHPSLHRLKNTVNTHVQRYLTDVMKIDVELYITNSWLNFTRTNQQHMPHNHTNSVLSGVYYIQVDNSQPTISFNRMSPPFGLTMHAREYDYFNSTEWNITVSNNDLIIFPSQCYHYVKPNSSSNVRISLAFNTYARGQFGGQGAELKL